MRGDAGVSRLAVNQLPSGTRGVRIPPYAPMARGVTGSTADFGSAGSGSNPGGSTTVRWCSGSTPGSQPDGGSSTLPRTTQEDSVPWWRIPFRKRARGASPGVRLLCLPLCAMPKRSRPQVVILGEAGSSPVAHPNFDNAANYSHPLTAIRGTRACLTIVSGVVSET